MKTQMKLVPKSDGLLRRNFRLFMSQALWEKLVKRAEEEGRKLGRPKSIAAVVRDLLQERVGK